MSTLSPAAEAMFSAFDDCYEAIGLDDWMGPCMAAALRAVADYLAPELPGGPEDIREDERLCVRDELLAIATELENHQ